MSYTAIADVGNTLIELLKDNIPIIKNHIHLCSPSDASENGSCLALFLYDIVENPYLKNQERIELNPYQKAYPPLTLDLYYLLTSYSYIKDDITKCSIEEQTNLGNAMKVFFENPVLSGSLLKGSLAERDENLRITMNHLSLEDLTKLWSTFTKTSFRPSVSYIVSPVSISSTLTEETGRIVTRDLRFNQILEVEKGDN